MVNSHTLPHKYRCPRCFVLTCSLPCIRRHKQWAQCSGLRDPAAYVKRADLATPKMIDHDYNYLTSLEREFDKADRDADARGFLLDEVLNNRGAKRNAFKGEVQMNDALERCGVIITKAPKGMSRAKANHTQWDREKRRLTWTVEWVHPDGRKEERQCGEDQPLSVAYAETCKPKKEYVTRKKRKLAKEKSQDIQNGMEDFPREGPSDASARDVASATSKQEDTQVKASTQESTPGHKELPSSILESNETKAAPLKSFSVETKATVHEDTESDKLRRVLKPSQSEAAPQASSSTIPQLPPQFEYYLHAPSLPSKEIVLVPFEPSATLASSLRNRLVLEFPTIYVFVASDRVSNCSRKVPEGFISEEDFFARARNLLVEEVDGGEGAHVKQENDEEEEINNIDRFGKDFDAERVLRVLGEDVKSFG